MTYPRTLHLTEDGTPIVVQRHTARAVATAARAAVGDLTFGDLDNLPRFYPGSTPAVWGLADWIARELGMDDAMVASACHYAVKKGTAR